MARLLLIVSLCLPLWAQGDVKKLDTQTPLHSVYVLPSTDTEKVTVGMVILAGEVDVKGPEGLSHYLEHLMFWHADKLGNETMHARDGNAWVDGIVTSYYNTGEASELADMFQFAQRLLTPPTSSETFMLGERKVVNREYDLRVSENPDWRVLTDMRKQLYDNHPVSRSVIGTRASIMSLTLAQARSFHRDYYHAANAVLIVSGNVTEAQVQKLTEAHFAHLPKTQEHQQAWRESPVSGKLKKTQIYPELQAKSDRLLYASLSNWSGQGDKIQDYYTRVFVERLFESALPGSLAKPLRLDNFIISEYQLVIDKLLTGQVELLLFGRPDKGVSLETAGAGVREGLAQLGSKGVPQKSFERIKKRWLQTALRESYDQQNNLWRLWRFVATGLEPNSKADHLQRIEDISKADVDSLMKALGSPERKITGYIKGE